MKLDTSQYFNNGKVCVTDRGWIELQRFCKSILYKQYSNKFTSDVLDDLVSVCLLACIDNLDKYDADRNDELGGYLYWKVRGEVTKYIQKLAKEIPTDMREDGFIEWMEAEQIANRRLQEYDI